MGLSHDSLHYAPTPPPRLPKAAKKTETPFSPSSRSGATVSPQAVSSGVSHVPPPCVAEILFQVAQPRGPGHSPSNQPSLLG